jgi:UDP-N-acetylglucosamine transferase subunit ALG13
MGTILSALQYQKPIIVMPRRASLGEARNEHQLATVRRLSDTHRIAAAADEEAPGQALDRLDQVVAHSSIGATAQTPLIEAVRAFIQER